MPEPALGLRSALSNESSFLKRIKENIESVWRMPRAAFAPGQVAAAGAPIHLLEESRKGSGVVPQTGSIVLHVAIIAGSIFAITSPIPPGGFAAKKSIPRPATKYAPPTWLRETAGSSLGRHGGGGENNPLPVTSGELPALSRIVLASPRLPDDRLHALPMQTTVYDADAPEITAPVNEIGLPWMKDRNTSAGSGRNGIGSVGDDGVGDDPGSDAGRGNDPGTYGVAASQVVCLRCPDPVYSNEARKQKVQGAVTLRVLVGADGRVKSLRVTRGIGMGLDESAATAVRAWQFIPAKDAARRPVDTWITVETMFRLY